VAAEDGDGGARFDIRARSVLNAAGPWAGEWLDAATGGAAVVAAPRLSRAMNLVIDRVTGSHACGGVIEGRFLFAVPWRDVSILGTSHDPHEGGADDPHGGPAHVERLLSDAAVAFPRARFDRSSVRLVHRGLLPMVSATAGAVSLLKESAVLDHAATGQPGLLSIFSVRYTTARDTASAAVDAVLGQLGRAPAPAHPGARPLTGAPTTTVRALVDGARRADAPGTTADLRSRLAHTYGTAYAEVTALVAAAPELARPLSATCAVTQAEVLHAARHESARTLADALLRRTEAGTAGYPGDPAVETAARVMATELGWTASRAEAEIAAVRGCYPSG
jgi:glycerol-3-phosphate dehydrogenase